MRDFLIALRELRFEHAGDAAAFALMVAGAVAGIGVVAILATDRAPRQHFDEAPSIVDTGIPQ